MAEHQDAERPAGAAGLGPGQGEVLAFLGLAGRLDRASALASSSRSSVGRPRCRPRSAAEIVLGDQELAVGVQPAVDLGHRLEHELGLLDRQLHGQRPDLGDRGLDPSSRLRSVVHRIIAVVPNSGMCDLRPAGDRVPFEDLDLAGADLERLGRLGQHGADDQVVGRHLRRLVLGIARRSRHQQQGPLGSTAIGGRLEARLGRRTPSAAASSMPRRARRRQVRRIGVEDGVDRDRVRARGQDRLEEVDLLVEEGHLDQERPAGGPGQVGVAEEAEAAVARRQGHVGHQAELLGLDRGMPQAGGTSSPQMFARTIGRGRGRDPRPEQAPGLDRAVSRRRCLRNV